MADHEKMSGDVGERLEVGQEQLDNQREALKNKLERERQPDNRAERLESAKNELAEQFKGERQGNVAHQPKQVTRAKTPVKKATKAAKKAAFKKTMHTIQKEMNPAERTFSKVLHNPVVERTSEVAGKTVARPAALLAGSLTALILVAAVYMVAKHYGYVLSGSEWIATFVIGWAIGLIIDWVRVALLGRRAGPA
jgi:hypothetical protein